MKDYKTAEEIFKENGYVFVKGWIAELEKRNITLLTDREMRAKELVDSWELVRSLDGLDGAKHYYFNADMCGVARSRLASAIADVESCT